MSWDRHEAYIARLYGGERTKGSGSQVTQKGDVHIKTGNELVECKSTEQSGKARIVKHMEKVAQEAYEEGLDPVLALRYYDPSSPLAHNGYVDLSVRLARDDAYRSELIHED